MLCNIFIAYPLSTQALLTYKVLCILKYRTIHVFYFVFLHVGLCCGTFEA